MKEKKIPIISKNNGEHSPKELRWPKKEEPAVACDDHKLSTPTKFHSSTYNIKRSPDLLFHSHNKQSVLGVAMFDGKPITLKLLHIFLFALVMIVLVAPFQFHALRSTIRSEKNYIMANIEEAGFHWKTGYSALQQGDFSAAEVAFTDAEEIFSTLANFPRSQHPILMNIIETLPVKPKQYVTFKDGVIAGHRISRAGRITSSAVFDVQSVNFSESASALIALEKAVHASIKDIITAHFHISRIDPSVLPIDTVEFFITQRNFFNEMMPYVKNFDALAGLIGSMAGLDGPRKWLIVFQNNAELRASGGFMGSYGLAKVDKGEVTIIDIPGGGTYDHRGSFRKNVISPEPLHLINPIWEFQDSNWWPDWPTTADKIIWFYEQGNGATVDGLVSFTPSFLERVLDITGPITLEGEYNLVIDKYNAYDVLQSYTERKQETTNEPKKIIGDLAATILETSATLLTTDDTFDILSLVFNSIEERQLLVYWNEIEGQALISKNGWDGALVDINSDDYLMVVHTNIAGGKSDRSIRDVVTLDSQIQSNGDIKNNLTLTRTHHGKEGTGFSGVRNVDYIRFYVPQGSELVGADGFTKPADVLFEDPPEGFVDDVDYLAIEGEKRYDNESGTEYFDSFNKTVFANWLMVDPGNSRSVSLEYILPQVITKMPEDYNFYIQKQSGWQGAQLDYSLSWPEGWKPKLVNGADPAESTRVNYSAAIVKDLELTTLWDVETYAKK